MTIKDNPIDTTIDKCKRDCNKCKDAWTCKDTQFKWGKQFNDETMKECKGNCNECDDIMICEEVQFE